MLIDLMLVFVFVYQFFNTFPTYVRHLESKGRHLSSRAAVISPPAPDENGIAEMTERMEAGGGIEEGGHEE